jgi:hypothetical protein
MARGQAFARRRGGPGINFLMLRVADRKAQRRHIRDIGCAVADLALDDEDRFAGRDVPQLSRKPQIVCVSPVTLALNALGAILARRVT